MKRLFFAIFLLTAGYASGQGARYDSVASTTLSIGSYHNIQKVVPNATVTVYQYGTTTPATLCTDITCATPALTNVVTSDSYGNFGFFILPGNYSYRISATGVTAQTFGVTIGGVGGFAFHVGPLESSMPAALQDYTQGMFQFNALNPTGVNGAALGIETNQSSTTVPGVGLYIASRAQLSPVGITADVYDYGSTNNSPISATAGFTYGNGVYARHDSTGTLGALVGFLAATEVGGGSGAVDVNADFYAQPTSGATINAGFYAADQGSNYGVYVVGGKNDLGPGATKVGTMRLTPAAFSALPTCDATTEGTQGAVTNSGSATWGDTITGTGSNHVLAYCDGTNWTVAGK